MMGELKLELHPDKTFIGRISHGFDFLGYWFSPEGLEIAPKTVERFVVRVSRLYEQGADFDRIGEYVRHWWRWVRSGVHFLLSKHINSAAWPERIWGLDKMGLVLALGLACSIQDRVFLLI